MLLAGDIGGTKTVVGLFQKSAAGLEVVREETFPSRDHGSLEEIIEKFLGSQTPLDSACFGVAGPVLDGKARTTNLPWELSEDALGKKLGTKRVKLLNDLEAAAFGMLFLKPEEFECLNAGGGEVRGHIVVIAPGTGLGEALLYWDGKQHHPVASEGGHADFAPRTDQEIDLLNYLRKKLDGHVSYERLLSGMGILNIYSFLRDTGSEPEPEWLKEKMTAGDASAAISQAALAGEDARCVETLQLFSAILGAEIGNSALKCLAKAAFVGGGIPPKILPALKGAHFRTALLDKGRFSKYMEALRVRVALNSRAPLIGAAHFLAR